MLYVLSLTIPANTSADSPVTAELTPKDRLIEHGRVSFPASDKVGVRFCDRQMGANWMPAPASTDGWLTGTSEAVQWGEDYELSGPPYRIIMCGYNTDASAAFTVRAQLEIVRWPMRRILRDIATGLEKLRTDLAEMLTRPAGK
jgi:hypothetical protein